MVSAAHQLESAIGYTCVPSLLKLSILYVVVWASQVELVVKNPLANAGDTRDSGSIPGSRDPLEKGMEPTPVLLPIKSHGQRSLVGYSPCGHKELDTTEHLNT